eukprot:scaffold271418_cov19-Tisochrysis_lutea.AAC.1
MSRRWAGMAASYRADQPPASQYHQKKTYLHGQVGADAVQVGMHGSQPFCHPVPARCFHPTYRLA